MDRHLLLKIFPCPALVMLLILCCIATTSLAQNVEDLKIDKTKPFEMRGNLFANHVLLKTNQNDVLNSSFNVGGNLALKLYGIRVPIQFAFRNSNLSLSNTLNLRRFGLSPSYKSVTLHGGYRSMSIHPHLYNGQTFLGGGAEIRTKSIEVKVMRGKLQNFITAIALDQVDEGVLESYDRSILAGSIGVRTKSFDLVTSVMKIKDDESTFSLPDSVKFLNPPKENLGFGIESNIRLGSIISWNNSVAMSGFTRDLIVGDQFIDSTLVADLEPYITVNNSSRYSFAIESRVNATTRNITVGLNYKRIDPEYTSLGLYQMNNDYQDIAINLGLRLFESRLTTNTRYGIRTNNVSDTRTSTDRRNILSVNANLRLTDNLNISGNYSDHGSERQAALVELGDSLQYVQSSRSFNISPTYNFNVKDSRHGISLNYLDQDYNSITNDDTDKSTTLKAYSARYNINIKESGLGFNLGARNNKNINVSGESIMRTVNVGARKRFKEQNMNVKMDFSIGNRTMDGSSLGGVMNIRGGYDLQIKGKHHLGITAQYNKRPMLSGERRKDTRIYTVYRYTIK